MAETLERINGFMNSMGFREKMVLRSDIVIRVSADRVLLDHEREKVIDIALTELNKTFPGSGPCLVSYEITATAEGTGPTFNLAAIAAPLRATDARKKTRAQCAAIVKKHYPVLPT